MPRGFLAAVLFLFLPGAMTFVHAGLAQYTDRGRTDFDTVVKALTPYGAWAKTDGLWNFTPNDHTVPYTDGRWLYTDYGWYWKGNRPYSWATEHYGYWKRGANRVWSWYPGPYWVAEAVEIRSTPTHIGWRSAAVDDDGNFVETAEDRLAHTDEWTFVTRAQFAGPITPAVIAPPSELARLLDDSKESTHAYTTYRPIDRPGPHPADFVALSHGNDGMFAPKLYSGNLPPAQPLFTETPRKPSPAQPKISAGATNTVTAAVKPGSVPDATTDKAAPDPNGDGGSPEDDRQVSYWTTMSLPTYDTPLPNDARPTETYLYRPNFAQDQDGIERRIALCIDPAARIQLHAQLNQILGAAGSMKSAPNQPAAEASGNHEAFQSPFADSFPGNQMAPKPAVSAVPSSKAAPDGSASSASGATPIK